MKNISNGRCTVNELFDKYDVYAVGESKYCYKGTNVLKNKLNIRDQNKLKKIETELSFAALIELSTLPAVEQFNKEHLLYIHKFIFNNIYSFAGKIREENIAKGNTTFCIYNFIEENLDDLFGRIKIKIPKDKDNIEENISFFAYVLAELNIIHPFREGNGRAIREFVRQFADSLGYVIDWSKVLKDELMDAMIESVTNLEKLIYCMNILTSSKD